MEAPRDTKKKYRCYHIASTGQFGDTRPPGALIWVGTHRKSKLAPFLFAPACVFCGSSVAGEVEADVREESRVSPLVLAMTKIRVPYCAEHLALTRGLRITRSLIYWLPYPVLVVLLLKLLPEVLSPSPMFWLRIIAVLVAGLALWALIVARLMDLGLRSLLMRLFDIHGLFDLHTGTYGFTARIFEGELYFYFRDPAGAGPFENANAGNPCVEHGAPAL